jgi:hypothetical protein
VAIRILRAELTGGTMHFVFDPESVAVMGARRGATGGGHRIIESVETWFKGPIYSEIAGAI